MGMVIMSRIKADFQCGQGVKHENLMGQDLNRSHGWKYIGDYVVSPLASECLMRAMNIIYKWCLLISHTYCPYLVMPYVVSTVHA